MTEACNERLVAVIPFDLKVWTANYCRIHRTNMSSLVAMLLENFKASAELAELAPVENHTAKESGA